MIGQTLGPYRIVAKVGEGGMGEVYRAHDARLGRDVAIKVLPRAVANDPDRLARFEREARAVAALSHPNIFSLHDFDTDNGVTYAVMELLEGETLRERLAAGPVPARKSIDIAIQIARGLASAHAKGLVHRDLKPENVFLLPDGQVKILDFGLARAFLPAGDAGETAMAGTDPGMVLGTVGYMAPEQIRGEPADARTDLFALGAVLYEMLSGRRAFRRETAAETMTAILREDPAPLIADRSDLSPQLERIVLHCLEKNPAERFQTARDAAFALETSASSGTSSGSLAPVSPGPARRRLRTGGAVPVIVAAAAAFVVGAVANRFWPQPAAPAPRLTQKTFDVQGIYNARFFTDGRTVIHDAARQGPNPDLFAIRPDRLDSEVLATESALLSVSSTGEMAVLTKIVESSLTGHLVGTLARVTSGTAPREMLDNVVAADWSRAGDALAAVHIVDGRFRIEYPLGTELFASDGWISDIRVSPGGDRVAFVDHFSNEDRARVSVVDRSKQVTHLTDAFPAVYGLAWTHDESTILFSASDEGARPVDRQLRSVRTVPGSPVHSFPASPGGLHLLDVSPSGDVLAVQPRTRVGIRVMVPGAADERELSWRDSSLYPLLSRDSTFVAFTDFRSSTADANASVWLRHTDGSPPQKLGPGYVTSISPDGRFVLGVVATPLQGLVYPTGVGTASTLALDSFERVSTIDWFPDSRHLVICGRQRHTAPRCYRGDILAGPLTPISPEGVLSAFVSPDGRTLLTRPLDRSWQLMSTDTGAVRPAAGLRTNDEIFGGWSADGQAVFTANRMSVPARLERVDLGSGARAFMRELAPPDRSGVTIVLLGNVIDNGRGYTYSYVRWQSTLYLIEGLLGPT